MSIVTANTVTVAFDVAAVLGALWVAYQLGGLVSVVMLLVAIYVAARVWAMSQ